MHPVTISWRTALVLAISERVNRERVFETALAVDMSTKIPWLGFTVEAMTSPFSEDNVREASGRGIRDVARLSRDRYPETK
jgi:hypothetical protein